jgi:hypothetical protein
VRLAVHREQRGRGEERALEREHAPHDDGRRRQAAFQHREHDVVALLERVDGGMLDVDLHPQLGVARHQLARHRPEVVGAELVGRGDAQGAGHRLALRQRIGVRLAQAVQQRADAVVERLAGLGQAHAARGALEEPRLQGGLEARDRRADAGLGTLHGLRRGGEAAVFDDVAEDVVVVPVHGRMIVLGFEQCVRPHPVYPPACVS